MTILAVRTHAFATPPRIVVDRIDTPTSASGHAIVRLAGSSVNPVDTATAEGKFGPVTADKLPVVLGFDVAGTIESVADDVAGWSPGDRVCGSDAPNGAHAELVSISAAVLARVPDGVSLEVAGALPVAGTTAWLALFDHGKLQDGSRVLIHGAAGGVGHIAVQLAKSRNCTVFATASADDLDFVRSLGADVAIDYRNERFEDVATDLDLVLDVVGGETQQRSFATLKKGGTLVSTVGADLQRAAEADVHADPFWSAHPDAAILGKLLDLIAAGTLRIEIARRFPLAEAIEAYRVTSEDHPRGKVALTAGERPG